MKRIIAAIDFSEISEAVIQSAEETARAFSASLTLLHVAAGDPYFVGYDTGPQTVRDSRAGQLRQEHRDLQALAGTLREAGIEAEAVLIEGPTVETILKFSQDENADLIILGSHGKGALRSALLGGVSQGILHHATCPLLVIPAGKRSADAPDDSVS